jgi:hypothetical protein
MDVGPKRDLLGMLFSCIFLFFEFTIQVIWQMLSEIELISNLVSIIQCTNGFIHCL